jgi:hypothetical protein
LLKKHLPVCTSLIGSLVNASFVFVLLLTTILSWAAVVHAEINEPSPVPPCTGTWQEQASGDGSSWVCVPLLTQATQPKTNTSTNTSVTVAAPSPAVGTVAVVGSARGGNIVGVAIAVDGAQIASCKDRQCTGRWDTLRSSNGSHSVEARAQLRDGRVVSSRRTVAVANDVTAPSVRLAVPAQAAGTVPITISASDASGIARIELVLDGTRLAQFNSGAVTFNWDSTTVSNSTHTIRATAYDGVGNAGYSNVVSVAVLNGSTSPSNPTPSSSPTPSVTYREGLGMQTLAINGYCQGATTNVHSGPAAGNDKVYLAYLDSSGGCTSGAHNVYVKKYDYTTGLWTTSASLAAIGPTGYDGHEPPSMFRDGDGYLWVFYGSISAGCDATGMGPFYRRSSRPDDITAWEPQQRVPHRGGFSEITGGFDAAGTLHLFGQQQCNNGSNPFY